MHRLAPAPRATGDVRAALPSQAGGGRCGRTKDQLRLLKRSAAFATSLTSTPRAVATRETMPHDGFNVPPSSRYPSLMHVRGESDCFLAQATVFAQPLNGFAQGGLRVGAGLAAVLTTRPAPGPVRAAEDRPVSRRAYLLRLKRLQKRHDRIDGRDLHPCSPPLPPVSTQRIAGAGKIVRNFLALAFCLALRMLTSKAPAYAQTLRTRTCFRCSVGESRGCRPS